MTQKHKQQKQKQTDGSILNLKKKLLYSNTNQTKWISNLQNGEKEAQNHIADKGLIFKQHSELIEQHIHTNTMQFKVSRGPEDMQMGNKYLRRGSTSLIIWESKP